MQVTVSYSKLQYIETPVSSSFTNKITKKKNPPDIKKVSCVFIGGECDFFFCRF